MVAYFIIISYTTITLVLSELTDNVAQVHHTGFTNIFYTYNSTVQLNSSSIRGNIISKGAIVYVGRYSFILLYDTTIIRNTVHFGRILYINKGVLESYNDTVIAENYGRISTVHFKDSKVYIRGKFLFVNNSGTFLIESSDVRFFSGAIFQNTKGLTAVSISNAFYERRGGALTSINSKNLVFWLCFIS